MTEKAFEVKTKAHNCFELTLRREFNSEVRGTLSSFCRNRKYLLRGYVLDVTLSFATPSTAILGVVYN